MAWLGVVADDVTGATDVASALRGAGHAVVVTLGVPSGELPDADAWVVALTTRQAPAEEAVSLSVGAARAVLGAGARVLYQKYCSTFDSTPRGNIGPVADVFLGLVEADSPGAAMVHTPATPRVGRTVRGGVLYVNGVPLGESPMRDHPLTPMRDSDLVRLLGAQSRRPVTADAASRPGAHVVVDAETEADLDAVARRLLAAPGTLVVGGAAGLAGALAREIAPAGEASQPPRVAAGRRLVVSGSCSERTREQVAAFPGAAIRVSAADAMTDAGLAASVLCRAERAWAAEPGAPVLVAATVDPARAAADQARWGAEPLARRIEGVLGEVAASAVAEHGVTRLISAGGETSGAVTGALGVRSLWVGPDVAPGVPWCVSADGVALLLKSGNFGPPDLFSTAWEVAP